MNIFEGARRVAKVIAGIAIVCTAAYALTTRPYITANYRVPGFAANAIKSYQCDSDKDHREHYSEYTSTGNPYTLVLCFAGEYSSEHGGVMIPYMIKDNQVWTISGYSPEFRQYASAYRRNIFELPKGESERLDERYENTRWSDAGSALVSLLVGLALFWLAVWITGWIVRGFMGIPRGQDHRVKPLGTGPETPLPT